MGKELLIKLNQEETADKLPVKLLEIKNEILTAQTKKITLTGIITKFENKLNVSTGSRMNAVINYKGYKILIPLREMGFEFSYKEPLESDEDKIKANRLFSKYLTSMLGAEVDFVILAIDMKQKFCVASRKAAMIKKRQRYYIEKGESGMSVMEEAHKYQYNIECRVTGVTTVGTLRVEVFGVEASIPRREIGYRFYSNLDIITMFSAGTKVTVKLSDLTVDCENDKISILPSIKAATPDTRQKNMQRYSEGDIVLGEVTNVTENAYYVAVGDVKTGIDIYCGIVTSSIFPGIGDMVSVKIGTINEEMCRVFGQINNVIKRAG